MAVKLSAEGGTLSSGTVTIEAGSVSSEEISVAPAVEGGTEVTVRVESAEFIGVVVVVDNEGNYSDIQTGLGQAADADLLRAGFQRRRNDKGPGANGGDCPVPVRPGRAGHCHRRQHVLQRPGVRLGHL